MVIELVSKKDCVNNGVSRYKDYVICGKGRIKRITNRDRKRCHNCGHDYGSWYEYFEKGRLEYRFLCRGCIDIIESGK